MYNSVMGKYIISVHYNSLLVGTNEKPQYFVHHTNRSFYINYQEAGERAQGLRSWCWS